MKQSSPLSLPPPPSRAAGWSTPTRKASKTVRAYRTQATVTTSGARNAACPGSQGGYPYARKYFDQLDARNGGSHQVEATQKSVVVVGGKKPSDPVPEIEYTQALSDADHDALTRLAELDTSLKHSVETLRVATMLGLSIPLVAASRGINGAVAFLRDELRNREGLCGGREVLSHPQKTAVAVSKPNTMRRPRQHLSPRRKP